MSQRAYARLIEQYGYPLYIYEEAAIAEQLSLMRETFPDFRIVYSLKTNPHAPLCRFMAEQGTGADAASSYEVDVAAAAGFPPEAIYYSAPGKTEQQLAAALGKCVITADSCRELVRLERLAAAAGMYGESRLPVGLRINPELAYGPGEFPEVLPGSSSKFGVDAECLPDLRSFFDSLRHIRPAGIHVFVRSQVLSPAALAASLRASFELALLCRRELGWNIDFINFGGGLGISSAVSAGLDMNMLRHVVGETVREYRNLFPGCKLLLESGRFLVGRAGTFVSRIEDIKDSRGTTYAIVPGGLSGFLRPSVMNLLESLPCAIQGPYEPFYSNARMHQISLPEKTDGQQTRVTVCGNLCTALDVLARDVLLPEPRVGDIVAVSNAGAYAASLSPFAFASFPRPPELFLHRNGEVSTA